jgi:hypothetical protein
MSIDLIGVADRFSLARVTDPPGTWSAWTGAGAGMERAPARSQTKPLNCFSQPRACYGQVSFQGLKEFQHSSYRADPT